MKNPNVTPRKWMLAAAVAVLTATPAAADFWTSIPSPQPLEDIALGNDGSVWATGADGTVRRWDGREWQSLSIPNEQALNISVDPAGVPWVVATDYSIWKFAERTWAQVPGRAKDIGISSRGAVWIAGPDGRVSRWNDGSWEQVEPVPGSKSAVRLDVDSGGSPWVVDSDGRISKREGSSWVLVPGSAMDIGAGANGSIWIAATAAQTGGSGIYWRKGESWAKVEGSAIRISVDRGGRPWVLGPSRGLFQLKPSFFSAW